MIRQHIKNSIKAIKAFDEIEGEHINNAIDWIQTAPEIFRIERPATPLKHLVCYTVLVDTEQNKILILENTKADLLLPSGGHPNKDELPFDAAIRELKEELNMEANFILQEPFFLSICETVGPTAGHIDVDLWYLLQGNADINLCTDKDDFKREFKEYGWYSFDEILDIPIENLDINMHRFVNKLKRTMLK